MIDVKKTALQKLIEILKELLDKEKIDLELLFEIFKLIFLIIV